MGYNWAWFLVCENDGIGNNSASCGLGYKSSHKRDDWRSRYMDFFIGGGPGGSSSINGDGLGLPIDSLGLSVLLLVRRAETQKG
jgi:hypothetical protein